MLEPVREAGTVAALLGVEIQKVGNSENRQWKIGKLEIRKSGNSENWKVGNFEIQEIVNLEN